MTPPDEEARVGDEARPSLHTHPVLEALEHGNADAKHQRWAYGKLLSLDQENARLRSSHVQAQGVAYYEYIHSPSGTVFMGRGPEPGPHVQGSIMHGSIAPEGDWHWRGNETALGYPAGKGFWWRPALSAHDHVGEAAEKVADHSGDATDMMAHDRGGEAVEADDLSIEALMKKGVGGFYG